MAGKDAEKALEERGMGDETKRVEVRVLLECDLGGAGSEKDLEHDGVRRYGWMMRRWDPCDPIVYPDHRLHSKRQHCCY